MESTGVGWGVECHRRYVITESLNTEIGTGQMTRVCI